MTARPVTPSPTISTTNNPGPTASRALRIRLLSALPGLAVALATVAACGSGGSSDPADRATASADPPGTDPATGTTLVARPAGPVDVYAAPGDGEPSTSLPATTGFGSARALPVLEQRDGWLHVSLPVRPNGTTGWLPAEGIEVREVTQAIAVDLDSRTLTLTDGGEEVLTTPAAVGTAEFPTPTGTFFVADKLATGEEDGAYGPLALGLSGYSDVLTEFAGGDGQVGIHGTNDPASIGEAVSHGCVRVSNDVITRLTEIVPLGTPVTIT